MIENFPVASGATPKVAVVCVVVRVVVTASLYSHAGVSGLGDPTTLPVQASESSETAGDVHE